MWVQVWEVFGLFWALWAGFPADSVELDEMSWVLQLTNLSLTFICNERGSKMRMRIIKGELGGFFMGKHGEYLYAEQQQVDMGRS